LEVVRRDISARGSFAVIGITRQLPGELTTLRKVAVVRTLEVVRHSLTRKGADKSKASHLSPDGVRLARQVGESMAQMDYVAVGDQPRHLETAIAMGFAVDEQTTWPSGYIDGEVGHHDQWTWEEPFVHYATLPTA
jgi:hypothetical protein